MRGTLDVTSCIVTSSHAHGREHARAHAIVARAIPLVDTPPHQACEVIVAIPARDEAATIGAAIAAVAAQRDRRGASLGSHHYEVLVLANNCRDATATVAREVAARVAPRLPVHVVELTLERHEAHSGRARQLAMDEAWRRLTLAGGGRGGGQRVIATTDADTVVAPDWIAMTLHEVGRGADVVGGRIVAASLDGLPDAARGLYLYDAGYRHLVAALDALVDPDPDDPWPRHHQHFGASLAVTASAYARVGGLEAVATLEDVRFHDTVVRAGLRVRHSASVRAHTSTRRHGRAQVGLATQIAEWVDAGWRGAGWPVESAAFVERWAQVRTRLRRAWTRVRRDALGDVRHAVPPDEVFARIAAAVRLTPPALHRAMRRAPSFDALIAGAELRCRFAGTWNETTRGPRHEDVRAAVRALRIRVATLRTNRSPSAVRTPTPRR